MSSSVDKSSNKSSSTQSALVGSSIIYGGIAWAVISLLFFLLFSISTPGQDSPFWYLIGTYILELIPFLAATILCYRNWRSPNIASGSNVWLGIGLGMLSFLIGGLLFGWWELYWGLDPDVSPADFFYLICYVFLGWGMVLAVLPRRLNLEVWQWVTVAVIAAVGIALAVWVLLATPISPKQANATTLPSAQEQVVATQTSTTAPTGQANSSDEATTAESDKNSERPVPAWVSSIQETLKPLSKSVNFSYIVGDVFLLIVASTLLLAFWGGRFALSWRMIAAATFSLYIADMWTKYATAVNPDYESGGLLEVFYVFSGVLFAIGAALEYDVSSRSRRTARRRA